jgi:hypothetical protein
MYEMNMLLEIHVPWCYVMDVENVVPRADIVELVPG